MAVHTCEFQIPEGNFEARGGLQALRANYGYGEYALEPCTETPLWVSRVRRLPPRHASRLRAAPPSLARI